MNVIYSDEQKALIMIEGDLLDGQLTAAEKQVFNSTLQKVDGDVRSALRMLPRETAEKANDLLTKGLKLSLELDKLSQRGVYVIFPDDAEVVRLDGAFAHRPVMLFAAGNRMLLEQSENAIVFSLSAFKKLGCNGVLVSDRAFNALLRDERVAAAIRECRALLVSDLMNTRASVKQDVALKEAHGKASDAGQPAKHVFISGSRTQTLIPRCVQDSLEAIVEQGIGVLVGDSDKGVDSEIIDFFRVPLYEYVTIFTISDTPRVTAEDSWRVRIVEADRSLKPQQRQMAKDRVMADEADWGLALFDPVKKNRYGSLQVSSGTLRNAIQMLLNSKMVKFFYMYEGKTACKNLKSLKDLEEIIESYRSERLSEAERNSILSSKGVSQDEDASAVKTRVMMAKYKTLRRNEEKLLAARDSIDSRPEPVQGVLPLFD